MTDYSIILAEVTRLQDMAAQLLNIAHTLKEKLEADSSLSTSRKGLSYEERQRLINNRKAKRDRKTINKS